MDTSNAADTSNMSLNHKRYLGIDFGTKRIGVAVSDPGRELAFPHIVISTTQSAIDQIVDICHDNDVSTIVIGESKDYSGKDNTIMPQARAFAKELETKVRVPVVFHPEFMTSMQAAHIQGEGAMLDASAAAIILQSYIDLNKNLKKHE